MSDSTVRESENVSPAVGRERSGVEDFVLSSRLTRVDGLFDMEFERTGFSDDTYAVIGRALSYTQKFEDDCRKLRLLLEAKAGKLDSNLFEDEASFGKFVNALDRKVLHKQISEIVGHLHLPDDVDKALQLARNSRNEIAHEICVGIQFDMETDAGRNRLVDQISVAIRRIAEAHLLVLAVVCLLTDEDLPHKDYLHAYCDRVVEWCCSP